VEGRCTILDFNCFPAVDFVQGKSAPALAAEPDRLQSGKTMLARRANSQVVETPKSGFLRALLAK